MKTELQADSVDNARLAEWFDQRAIREHDLLNPRSHIPLVYHSILMAGFAATSVRLGSLILVAGVVGALIWWYVGHRTLLVADYYGGQVRALELLLPDEARIHSKAKDWRDARRPVFPRKRDGKCLTGLLKLLGNNGLRGYATV